MIVYQSISAFFETYGTWEDSIQNYIFFEHKLS